MRLNQSAADTASRSNRCDRPALRCADFRSARSLRCGCSFGLLRYEDRDGHCRQFDRSTVEANFRLGCERYAQVSRVVRDRYALLSRREVANDDRAAAVDADPARLFVEGARVEAQAPVFATPTQP